MNEATEIIVKARALIHEKGWRQGPGVIPRFSGRLCAGEALLEAQKGYPYEAQAEAWRRVEAVTGRGIVVWNDAPGRSEREVDAAFAAAEEEPS